MIWSAHDFLAAPADGAGLHADALGTGGFLDANTVFLNGQSHDPDFSLTEKIFSDASGYRAMQALSLKTTTVAGPCEAKNGQNAPAPASRQTIMKMSSNETVRGQG